MGKAGLPAYATELVPVGPLRVRLARPKDQQPVRASRLVAGGEAARAANGDWLELSLERVLEHQVVVLE